jgi:flagellar hook assembly protein FlgD
VSPNPARQGCTIVFSLAREGAARLEIFDLAGRRVRTLERGVLAAGEHRTRWDGRGADGRPAGAGLYFAALSSGEGRFIARFAVTR